MKRTHLDRLDYLRGIAILMVFLFHCQLVLFPASHTNAYGMQGLLSVADRSQLILVFSPAMVGWSGVHLFLIISGFLIHLGFLQSRRPLEPGDFYSKRFWRIYPPYLISLVFIVLTTRGGLVGHLTNEGLKDLLLHVTLLHNLTDSTMYSINGAFWSLALEAQLYVIYPLLLTARERFGMKEVFLMTIVLSFLMLGLGRLFPTIGDTYSFELSVFKNWFTWAGGAYLAELHVSGRRLFGRKALLAGCLLMALTIASKAHLAAWMLKSYLATAGLMAVTEHVIYDARFPLKSRIFKSVVVIGLCSYSIYLFHLPYLRPLFQYFTFTDVEFWKHAVLPLRVATVFAILFCISYSLYLFVELPSVRLGRRIREWRSGIRH